MLHIQKFLQRIAALGISTCLLTGMFSELDVLAVEKEVEAEPTKTSIGEWVPQIEENHKGELSLAALQYAKLKQDEIPEVISLDQITEKKHVHRLYEQEEDLHTVIFQNIDGSKTMYYFSEPIKFIDEDGTVHDKSNKLYENIGKNANMEHYSYETSSNDIKTYFPKVLSQENGILLEYDDIRFEMTPEFVKRPVTNQKDEKLDKVFPNTLSHGEKLPITDVTSTVPESTSRNESNVNIQLWSTCKEYRAEPSHGEKQTLQKDEQTEEGVLYKKVFGESTSIRYIPMLSGFKEEILLSENVGINEFSFIINTNGLTLVPTETSAYFINPLTGKKVAALGEIQIFDSSEPDDITKGEQQNYKHKYKFKTLKADETYRVTLVIDPDYLDAPTTNYPVTIDPSITMGYTWLLDTTIYSNYQRPTGDHVTLSIGNYSVRNGTTRGVGRALLAFPGLSANGVYQSLSEGQLNSVTLYLRDLTCENDTVWIDCYRMVKKWSEAFVTCDEGLWKSGAEWQSEQKITSGGGVNSPGGSSKGNWYGFDITKAAKMWKNGYGEYGVMLKARDESLGSRTFASTENQNYNPCVVIDFSNYRDQSDTWLTSGAKYYIKNLYSGYNMDVDNAYTSNGTSLLQYRFNGNNNQQFELRRTSNGYYKIIPQNATDKALILNSENRVVLSDDCATDRALWRIKRERDGYYSIINRYNESNAAYTLTCSDGCQHGCPLIGKTYGTGSRFRWKISRVDPYLDHNDDWDTSYDLLYEENGLLDYLNIISEDILRAPGEFTYGIVHSAVNAGLWGIPDKMEEIFNTKPNYTSIAYYAGSVIGDAIGCSLGIYEAAQGLTQIGTGTAAGGAFALASGGVSILAGVSVAATGAVVVVSGGVVINVAVQGIWEHTDYLIRECRKASPYTRAPRRPSSSNPHYVTERVNSDLSTDYIMKTDDGTQYTVRYSKEGFPDFSPYKHPTKGDPISIELSGNRDTDFRRANAKVGLSSTPENYIWHHMEDGRMMLVRKDIHALFPHTGGFALYK